jgi:membrane protein YdbS with pleckstrin-like domain
MTNQDGRRNVPAQRKRITRELLWICGAAAISQIVAGVAKLGFWSSTALTAVIMLAVMFSLGVAAKRERKRMESQLNSESRGPRI